MSMEEALKLRSQAQTLVQQGQYDQAIPLLQQAVRFQPSDASAYSLLGIACSSMGRNEDALEAFRQAVSRDPMSAKHHYNYGAQQYAMGKRQDALSSLQKAVQIDPSHKPAADLLKKVQSEPAIPPMPYAPPGSSAASSGMGSSANTPTNTCPHCRAPVNPRDTTCWQCSQRLNVPPPTAPGNYPPQPQPGAPYGQPPAYGQPPQGQPPAYGQPPQGQPGAYGQPPSPYGQPPGAYGAPQPPYPPQPGSYPPGGYNQQYPPPPGSPYSPGGYHPNLYPGHPYVNDVSEGRKFNHVGAALGGVALVVVCCPMISLPLTIFGAIMGGVGYSKGDQGYGLGVLSANLVLMVIAFLFMLSFAR